MSNSCGAMPVPCNPDSVPELIAQLVDINRESRATAIAIKEKLFGAEKCADGCSNSLDQSGYIGDLKRLIRETGEVMDALHFIASAL